MKVYQNLRRKNEQVADLIFMNRYQIKGRHSAAGAEGTDNRLLKRLWVNDVEILPEVGSALRPFYECGFDWGSGAGNRTYTTALTICLAIFREERLAENLFVCFNVEFVQNFPRGDFDVQIDLSDFLQKYRLRLQSNLFSFFCFSSLINAREILMHRDPLTAELTVDLSENYSMHNQMIADEKSRMLSERKQKLVFRFFKRDNYIVKGYDQQEVMHRVEDIMAKLYWKSLEKVLRAQYKERSR